MFGKIRSAAREALDIPGALGTFGVGKHNAEIAFLPVVPGVDGSAVRRARGERRNQLPDAKHGFDRRRAHVCGICPGRCWNRPVNPI